jgi:hypothetical protein
VNEALVAGGYAWGYLGDTKVKDFDALLNIRKTNEMRDSLALKYPPVDPKESGKSKK